MPGLHGCHRSGACDAGTRPHPTRLRLGPRRAQGLQARVGTRGPTEAALMGALLPLPYYTPPF